MRHKGTCMRLAIQGNALVIDRTSIQRTPHRSAIINPTLLAGQGLLFFSGDTESTNSSSVSIN